ncbi:MAG: MFS transporter [Simkaniaceae bacterium]|nr:MAG: MFS transporter [Simkaniaceae bacterium]
MRTSKQQFWINFAAASTGNLFEHYDKALFAFLAPFLAPLFFETSSPITALIYTYAMMPLGLFSRPLGALIFGRIGDRRGRKSALCLTLLGMALTTTLMGCIPTYKTVGWVAPSLLALGRLIQNFFASGETTGGSLLILESCPNERRSFYNGLYGCSTILGILIASFGVTALSFQGSIETTWRMLYWIGGITGAFGLFMRFYAVEGEIAIKPRISILPLLWKYRFQFLMIVFTSGFSYANYYMITSFLNGYLPLIGSITKGEAMQANTYILGFDFLLLPLAGILATRFPKEKLLLFFGGLICVLAIPLYSFLPTAPLMVVMAIRLVFVSFGVGFSVVLAPFYQDLIPAESRYTLIAFGNAIGSQLLGTSACSFSFFLYKQTGWAASPALYLMGLATVAIFSVYLGSRILTSSLSKEKERDAESH